VLLGTFSGTHLGTLWELDGNTLGTRGNKKLKNPSPPTPPWKEKKRSFMSAC
jgi:hypothetical protein